MHKEIKMFNYYCLNPIAKVGLDNFSADFKATDDINAAEGILVRSAAMHDMEFSDNVVSVKFIPEDTIIIIRW